jgi:hypothetical protein
MSQRRTVYQWFKVVAQRMSHLSKPQAFNLSAASIGLALAKGCTLAHMAESLWCLGRPDPVERRLQRFLANSRITNPEASRALTAWVLESLVPGGRVVLLVDETSLKDKLKVMAVSLAYRGRALPLAWWCYHQERWPMGQVELIRTLLGWVAAGMPKGRRVLVQADRGIGNSPALLRLIEGMGWQYLVRVGRGVQLQLEDNSVHTFGKMVPEPGSLWRGQVQAFKKAGWMPCWAVGTWRPGSAEPWLLLTNDPQAQAQGYALRMWEEEAFKDFKSNGWQWQRSHVWNPQHADRLWLVMALAYLWMISLGTAVLLSPHLLRSLTRGRTVRLSVFRLGLRYFHHLLATHRIPALRLVLIPCQKSVV